MYMFWYMYMHVYMCEYIHIRVYVYMHMYINVYTYIYIYIYGSPPPIDPYFWASTTYSGRHLMRNQVFGFRDTLPPSAMPGGGPP